MVQVGVSNTYIDMGVNNGSEIWTGKHCGDRFSGLVQWSFETRYKRRSGEWYIFRNVDNV